MSIEWTITPDPNENHPADRRYFNRTGAEISYTEWARLDADDEYIGIVCDRLGHGERAIHLTTTWDGFDHDESSHVPRIFHTGILSRTHPLKGARWTWPTESEAIQGHERIRIFLGSLG